jgi:hypothetical protein
MEKTLAGGLDGGTSGDALSPGSSSTEPYGIPARTKVDPCPIRAKPSDAGRPEGTASRSQPGGSSAEETGPGGTAPGYIDASRGPAPHASGGLVQLARGAPAAPEGRLDGGCPANMSSSGRTVRPEESQGLGAGVSREELSPRSLGMASPGNMPEERAWLTRAVLEELEVDVLERNKSMQAVRLAKRSCLELIDLARHELPCTWVPNSQKHRLESYPLGKEHMHVRVNLDEKVLQRDHKGESQGSDVGLQPAKEGSSSDETSATSGAEEYVVLSPTTLEMRRLRPTRARMRRVLDYYPKKEIRTVNNPKKMKHTKQCLFIKEPVKTEDANTEGQRQALEKPTKVKSVPWVPRGVAKAMLRKTPTRSSWRIWDPGQGEAYVVLRG